MKATRLLTLAIEGGFLAIGLMDYEREPESAFVLIHYGLHSGPQTLLKSPSSRLISAALVA